MAFEKIIGQSRPKQIVGRAVARNKVPHAYLFHGARGIGKSALALELAQALLCISDQERPCYHCSNCRRISQLNHPDVFFIYPSPANVKEEEHKAIITSFVKDPYMRQEIWANPSIGIDRIRELRRSAAIKPLEGSFRIVIIADAERMTVEAANALLKILEEPPDMMKMVLTTSNIRALLPTIISRCQQIQFELLSDEAIEDALISRYDQEPVFARLISKLALGSFRTALELLGKDLKQNRERVIEIMRAILKDNASRLAIVDELNSERDKKLVKELLGLMMIWLRDAMIINLYQKHKDTPSRIINIDQIETLQKFANAYVNSDYENAIAEIEKAMQLIDRNMLVNLVLMVLFNRLYKLIKRK